MPGSEDSISPKVVFSATTLSSSTVSSLSVAVSTSSVAGVYAPIVVQPPAITIAPPDHPIYTLVGRAASAWAHLDHTLDLIIWDLLSGISACETELTA